MTLIKKMINGKEYYTDNKVYYTFHQFKNVTDTLWDFACMDLGITKQMGFTSQELKNITDLAGTNSLYPTKFLLLKDGNAIPVPYLESSSNLHLNDIILRSVVDPTVQVPVSPPATTGDSSPDPVKSIADRLQEIEDLHNTKLITDQEYQEKRAKIIAEL